MVEAQVEWDAVVRYLRAIPISHAPLRRRRRGPQPPSTRLPFPPRTRHCFCPSTTLERAPFPGGHLAIDAPFALLPTRRRRSVCTPRKASYACGLTFTSPVRRPHPETHLPAAGLDALPRTPYKTLVPRSLDVPQPRHSRRRRCIASSERPAPAHSPRCLPS